VYCHKEVYLPQGSVLGTILFLIYINDLSRCSNFTTILYADDGVLTMSHKNVNCLQTNLDYELPKIDHWLKSNQLTLNMNKTNYLFFNITKQKFNLKINNRPINHETKLSAAAGALYKLSKYSPKRALMAVC